jgi:hypothetical protein
MRGFNVPSLRHLLLALVLASAWGCDGGYDSNNDGVADDLGAVLDADGNGEPDLYDLDRDGNLDGIGVDTNGDAVADAIALDEDQDGFYEAIAVKDQLTGQDKITRSQLVPLPAPVYPVGQNPSQPG